MCLTVSSLNYREKSSLSVQRYIGKVHPLIAPHVVIHFVWSELKYCIVYSDFHRERGKLPTTCEVTCHSIAKRLSNNTHPQPVSGNSSCGKLNGDTLTSDTGNPTHPIPRIVTKPLERHIQLVGEMKKKKKVVSGFFLGVLCFQADFIHPVKTS